MPNETGHVLETITLAGGCFWCTEAVFGRVRGVVAVQSGYANGHVPHPSYEQVCTGATGHAEAVRVQFDPAHIGIRELLEIFFATHDPTTLNRQGHDVGPQYRSGIYTTHPEHDAVARALLQELQEGGHFGAPIVTELAPLTAWWPAEDYHTDYFNLHPHQGYCAAVIAPKLEKFRATFARFLNKD